MKRHLIFIALVPFVLPFALPVLIALALHKFGESRTSAWIGERFESIPKRWQAAVLYSIVYGVLFLIGWILGT